MTILDTPGQSRMPSQWFRAGIPTRRTPAAATIAPARGGGADATTRCTTGAEFWFFVCCFGGHPSHRRRPPHPVTTGWLAPCWPIGHHGVFVARPGGQGFGLFFFWGGSAPSAGRGGGGARPKGGRWSKVTGRGTLQQVAPPSLSQTPPVSARGVGSASRGTNKTKLKTNSGLRGARRPVSDTDRARRWRCVRERLKRTLPAQRSYGVWGQKRCA